MVTITKYESYTKNNFITSAHAKYDVNAQNNDLPGDKK